MDDLQEKDQECNRGADDEGSCCETTRQGRAAQGQAGPQGCQR